MVGRARSTPGFRSVSWLTVAALLGAMLAALWLPAAGWAQDDDASGYPPDGFPRSVTVDDEQFLFDRVVTIDTGSLTEVGADEGTTLYATSDSAPFDRLYGTVEGGEEGQSGRYLPVQLGSDDPVCATDDATFSIISTGDGLTYAFAGQEVDFTVDSLVELGGADLGDGEQRTLYGDRNEPPFPEFIVSGDGDELLRFVLLTDDIPEQLSGEIPIGEQIFTVEGNVAEEIDPASLVDVGCAGPFPLRAANDVTEPFSELFAPVGDRLLRLVAQDVPDDDGDEGTAAADEDADAEEDATEEIPIEDADDTDQDDATADATVDPGDDGQDGEDGEDGEDAGTPDEEVVAILPLPDELPLEITIEDERFLLDRSVPLDRGDLERVGRDESLLYYARTDEGPFDAVYVSSPPRSQTALARYLPERIGQSDAPCVADANPQTVVEFNGVQFAFAGYETDITTGNLVRLETGDDSEIYAEQADADAPELFVPDGNGLGRYLRLGDDGQPGPFAEGFIFAGEEFTIAGDVTGAVDPATLARVGCAGPFPVSTDPGQPESPFGDLFVQVDGLVLQYSPADGTPVPVEPTVVPEEPTEVPTETPVPTETAVPTEVPTETPAPTEVPTEVPTETPVPTEVPTETPVPTEVPTEAPDATETSEATLEPAESPTATTETETEEPTATTEVAEPTATVQLQPPAIVPTLPADVPPPAAATAAVSRCSGNAGALDVSGLPERLPRRIQYRGTAFSFAQTEAVSDAGSLTRLGCAGAFDVYATDLAPAAERLYLRLGDEPDSPLYRFNAARTFTVEVEVTGQVRVVRTNDANYELVGRYERSIYSSVTAILFVDDAGDPEPAVIYALRVDADVIGRYEPESESLQAPSDELAEQAQQAYVNPDLLLNGRRYVLTELLTPQGTTTNGFVTLYAIPNQETPDLFLGVDPREPDLLVFQRVGEV